MFGFAKMVSAVALLSTVVDPLASRPVGAPAGWHAGGDSTEYVVGADVTRRPGGYGYESATIRSVTDRAMNFGLLKQSIRADDFRGRRVRLSGYIRTAERNDGGAHLWMRVDNDDASVIADYMLTRPVAAGIEWTRYSVVLDVPANAVGITFGFGLSGAGQAWLDDVTLTPVGRDVPVTTEGGPGAPFAGRAARYLNAPRQPVNLDFEQQTIAMR